MVRSEDEESGEIVVADSGRGDAEPVTSSRAHQEQEREERPSKRERRGGNAPEEVDRRAHENSDRNGRRDRAEESSRRSGREDSKRDGRHAGRDDAGRSARSDSHSRRRPRADEGREVSGREGSSRDRGGGEGSTRDPDPDRRDTHSRFRGDRDTDLRDGGHRQKGDSGRNGVGAGGDHLARSHKEEHRRRDERDRDRGHKRRRKRSHSRSRDPHRSRSRSQRRSRSRSRSPRRNGNGKEDRRRRTSEDEGAQDLPPDVEDKLLKFVGEADEEAEEQRRIEERRRRLQEIKLKHQLANAQGAGAAVPAHSAREVSEPPASELPAPEGAGAARVAGASDADDADDPTTAPAAAPIADGERTPEGDRESDSDSEGGGAGGPVMDIFAEGDAVVDDATAASIPISAIPSSSAPGAARKVTNEPGGALVRQRTQDADEEDDMFAEHAPEDKFGTAAAGGTGGQVAGGAPAHVAALADAYDDPEGYYNFVVGEMMDGRYEVFASNGKGVFSSVVRARDTMLRDEAGRHPEVAIKLIRSNETMFKAAQMEVQVLKLLGAADPDNHKHCIKLVRHFEYRNHMCLVFEPMAMNLRDLTRKFGRNKGLDIKAVQLFTCQLLIALRHLRKHNVLHADIKPDNILINHRHNKVKLCDFGSAMFLGENEATPYLVSRFYRAPEVILGLKYEFGMDIWSIGCVIYELFTGRILFPGHSNNEMLKLMMEVKGPFTKKMLRKGLFVDKHFENDQNMSFALMEDDPITKTRVRRLITNPTVKHNFSQLLQRGGSDKVDKVLVAQLADLLEKMMNLEPEKRIDCDAALKHPFVRDVLPKRKEGKPGSRKQQS